MMKELSLREIQLGELEILKKIKEICNLIDIDYFLFCGTLLGAIRHHGIIPWDDDIDVGMMRSDYECFISYCKTHEKDLLPFKLFHYSTHKKYIYPIARFVDTRFAVKYKDFKDYGLGLFVDLYPFDGCGNTLEERNIIFKKVRGKTIALISLGARSNILFNHGVINYIVKTILWLIAKVIGQNKLIRRVDERAKKYGSQKYKYVQCIIWDSFRAKMFHKVCFDKLIEVPFEDDYFKVPIDYDKVLREEYGDYMELPPEEERIGHHYYKAYKY